MVMHLTIKEKAEMKRFGYTMRAFFVTQRGVPFRKDFKKFEEMMDFVRKAREVGTSFTGYLGIDHIED